MSQLSPVLPTRLASCPSLWVSAPCHSCAPAPLHSRAGTCLVPCPPALPVVVCRQCWCLARGCRGDEAAPSQVGEGKGVGKQNASMPQSSRHVLAPLLVLRASQAGVAGARQEWREPLTCPLGVGVERLGSRLSSCQGPSCEHPTVLQDLADLTPLGLHSPHGSAARSLWAAPALLPPRATLVPAPATLLPQPSPLPTQDLAPFH